VLVNPLRSLPFAEPAAPKGLGRFFKKVTGESEGSTGYSAEALTADPTEAGRWSSSELTHETITLRSIEEARRAEAEHLVAAVQGPVPTLLIRGLADPLAPPAMSDDLAAAATGCVDLESARHHPFQDAGRAEAIETLRAWLDGQLPRA
jgi:alpha-beta hydrolase superfamily lysophospholipase